MTSHPAGGPNATATSPVSTRQSLACVCLSPDPPDDLRQTLDTISHANGSAH